MQIQKRQALEADVPFLLQLRDSTMGPHRRATGIDGPPDKCEAKVRLRFSSAEILEIDGRPIGLLKVSRQNAEWELLQLQIASEFQGQGIGGRLVSGLIAQAATAGVPLKLSVLKVNPALRLYERLGFRLVSESEIAYGLRIGD